MASAATIPKIQPLYCGTSHVCEWHHLPKFSRELFKDNKKFEMPQFLGESGGKINGHTVNTIRDRIQMIAPQPIVIVLIYGGNNVCDRQAPEHFFPFFEQLVNMAYEFENLHFIVCGLIPRPKTDAFTKSAFAKASTLLKNLCKRNHLKATFLSTAKLFGEDGAILTEFYHERRGSEVHMNEAGAKILAKAIFNAIRSIPKSTFN